MSAILFLFALAALVGGIVTSVVQTMRDDHEKIHFGAGLLGLVLAIPFFLGFMSYSPVDAGYVGVVTRMGAVVGTIQPGPHFVTPFVSHVDQVSTKTMTVSPDEDASSLDLQQVHIRVTLAYHFDSGNIAYIYSNLIDSTANAVETKVVNPAILEAIKASTAKYTVQQLVEQRAKVRDDIEAMVKARIAPYHIVAETTSITDFRFSQEFEKSIEQKQVAQQAAEQAENVLKKVKIEAEQKVAAAEGEAAALKSQKEQITPELLQLRMIEMLKDKWDGRLPESYFGGQAPLPIVDAFKNSHIDRK
jgi:prohibitin 2